MLTQLAIPEPPEPPTLVPSGPKNIASNTPDDVSRAQSPQENTPAWDNCPLDALGISLKCAVIVCPAVFTTSYPHNSEFDVRTWLNIKHPPCTLLDVGAN